MNASASRLCWFVLLTWSMDTMLGSTAHAEQPRAADVTINTDFPGGNVKIVAQENRTVQLAPDLRGGRPWFYWYFEASVAEPGKVRFEFPDKVAGFKNGAIGRQGPAISLDRGQSWKWMGTATVDGAAFEFDFPSASSTVRFAVTIPYVQSNLEAFLQRHADNPHLEVSTLTTSRHGRRVELLRIGKPGPEVQPVLFTARHHAAETMASYLLEGVLAEAMSSSEVGREFRDKYVLYVVPLVDKDGVQEGDQGKNRQPHDHNRDYGPQSIYPEIKAIKALARQHAFRFALDFHCPTLVMDDHQVMYFVGPKETPAYNFENVSEFARWIKKGLPETAPVGPFVWLRETDTPAPMNSNYFGFRDGTVMAATLEFPFAPPEKATDPSSCRQYGRVILAAWVATHFRAAEE